MVAPIAHEVRPGVGLGPLRLGAKRDEVLELIGRPTEARVVDYAEGVPTHEWEYETMGLSLSFDAEDDYRLGLISTSFERAILNGICVVGLSETELLDAEFGGLGPPVLDDDFEEIGRDYVWDSLNLSCWTQEGRVVSISVMPLYDTSGEVPHWPPRDA